MCSCSWKLWRCSAWRTFHIINRLRSVYQIRMCSARKLSLFQGFLVEFWCVLQKYSASWQNCDVFYKKDSVRSHWNEQKHLLERCSSNIFSFLTAAERIICKITPFGGFYFLLSFVEVVGPWIAFSKLIWTIVKFIVAWIYL